MTEKKSILDRLASGEIKLTSESAVKSDPNYQAGIDATIRAIEEPGTALATPRKTGRPSKTGIQRATKVHSLRLESALWLELENSSEVLGCSVNRYIEEAILLRMGLIELPPSNAQLEDIDSILMVNDSLTEASLATCQIIRHINWHDQYEKQANCSNDSNEKPWAKTR